MTLTHWAVTSTIRRLSRVLCRVDDAQLARVPARGPLILVMNHVNFLDVPLLYTHLQPRPVTGLAKVETWDNPALAFLFDLGGAIPLRRGEADLAAMRRGLAALRAGQVLAVAPEGTRSGHGRLQRGHPGVVWLALHSGAPLLPVAQYGGENLKGNLARLRRTDLHIAVGRPFYLQKDGLQITREVRRQMVDEIMCQLAALLPPAYRGYYAGPAAAGARHLRFPAAGEGNLHGDRCSEL